MPAHETHDALGGPVFELVQRRSRPSLAVEEQHAGAGRSRSMGGRLRRATARVLGVLAIASAGFGIYRVGKSEAGRDALLSWCTLGHAPAARTAGRVVHHWIDKLRP